MIIRRWIQYILLFVVAAAAVFVVIRHDASSPNYAEIGKEAPPFALTNLQGEELRLDDYKGKGVVINFWASWCNPCVNELPLLNEAYKLAGVEMIAVNVGENAETVQRFVDRYDLEFPVALDADMFVKGQYRVVGLPLTALIDADGELIERHEGELTDMADILSLMAKVGSE